MTHILIALENYREHYGNYPPIATKKTPDRPSCSWRVLLLPFLNLHELYQQYDFLEPWDSPSNRQLLRKTPWVYRCPGDNSDSRFTSYLAVEGKGTDWGRGVPDGIAPDDMGLIIICEAVGDEIEWTRPEDVTLGALKERNKLPATQLANHSQDRTLVRSLGAGGSHTVSVDELAEAIEGMISEFENDRKLRTEALSEDAASPKSLQ